MRATNITLNDVLKDFSLLPLPDKEYVGINGNKRDIGINGNKRINGQNKRINGTDLFNPAPSLVLPPLTLITPFSPLLP